MSQESKEREIAVAKIVVKIGARDIELTLDEARRLQGALNDLLAERSQQSVLQFYRSSWPVVQNFQPVVTCTSSSGGC